MNIHSAVTALALVPVMLFSSCSKDEEVDYREVLVSKDWTMTVMTLKISYNVFSQTYDGYSNLPECNKDDILVFLENGELQTLQNANKCDINAGEIIGTGTWTLNGSNLQVASDYFTELIQMAGDAAPVPFAYTNNNFDFEIRDLTTNVMRLFLAEVYIEPTSQTAYNIEIVTTYNSREK